MDGVRAAIVAARAEAPTLARRWRESAAYRATAAVFADCPADDPEPAAAAAERLLADPGWAQALLAPMVEALAADPLAEPPLRVSRDRLRTGAILFDSPAISIAASVTNAAALRTMPLPGSLVFTGRLAVTRVLRGAGARLLRWRVSPMAAEFSAAQAPHCVPLPDRMLEDGAVYRLDGRVEAQLLATASQDVVTIVATAKAGADTLVREHDRASGAFRRAADAGDRGSRSAMLLAFLRLAGRADAAPCFDAISHDAAFHLRWTAMREWLALDAASALPRLRAMALADSHDEVRAAATRTLAVLESRVCHG